MRKLTSSLLAMVSTLFCALPVTAQQSANTLVLPDAKPGECYAKVITPATFSTSTEEIVVQEESERIETIEAVYEPAEQSVMIRESVQQLTAVAPVFEQSTEQVETRAAELSWTTQLGNRRVPASPDAVEHIARSGIDTETAEPNDCFVEYFTPAQYETETVRVLVKEASQTVTVIPAEFETIQQRIVVKEASSEVVDVPAVYRTETESVLVEPARSVWQEDCGLIERVDNATGEVLCLVEVPARYETLTKTVLDTPATTKTLNIPAVYKTVDVERLVRPAAEQRTDVPAEYTTVEKQVKVADAVFFWLANGETADSNAVATGREICLTQRPAEFTSVAQDLLASSASTTSVTVPATFESIPIEKIVTPATERRIVIPARTRTVTSQVELSPASVEWRKVLCEANVTRSLVASLQRALEREGFDPGPVDGILGRQTVQAIEEYQVEQGLDRGGITYETLQHLEVQS